MANPSFVHVELYSKQENIQLKQDVLEIILNYQKILKQLQITLMKVIMKLHI